MVSLIINGQFFLGHMLYLRQSDVPEKCPFPRRIQIIMRHFSETPWIRQKTSIEFKILNAFAVKKISFKANAFYNLAFPFDDLV